MSEQITLTVEYPVITLNVGVGTISAGGGVTDHGALTGLGDDDHTQYAKVASNLSDLASAATARTNLGLGSIATQDAGSVAITGGSVAGITDLAVADGGTGASTAADARTNLGLVIGTHVQAYDVELAAISAVTSAADKVPYFTGAGTASVADFTAFGRSLAGGSFGTFSDADDTFAAGELGLIQTGTLTATRTVTLPAANSVERGTLLSVSDASGSASFVYRISLAAAGGDSIVGWPSICRGGGFLAVRSDGTSKWVVEGTATPDLIWAASGTDDLGTVSADASAVMTVAWSNSLLGDAAVHWGGYVFSSNGGAATRFSAWPIASITMPATKRFTAHWVQGPRSSGGTNYGAVVNPYFFFTYQDVTRWLSVQRNATTREQLDWHVRDNSTATPSATADFVRVGMNTDYGAPVSVDVEYKEPAASTDPIVHVSVRAHGADAINSSIRDGKTLVGSAWDAAWKTGGNLTIAVGGSETSAGAGSSYIGSPIITRHPYDK